MRLARVHVIVLVFVSNFSCATSGVAEVNGPGGRTLTHFIHSSRTMFANLQSSCALVFEEDAEDSHPLSGPAPKLVLPFQVPDRAVIRLPNRARGSMDNVMLEDVVAPSIDFRAIPSPTRSAHSRGFSAKVPRAPAATEVFQSISCMPGLRESSFEVRPDAFSLSCYAADRH